MFNMAGVQMLIAGGYRDRFERQARRVRLTFSAWRRAAPHHRVQQRWDRPTSIPGKPFPTTSKRVTEPPAQIRIRIARPALSR